MEVKSVLGIVRLFGGRDRVIAPSASISLRSVTFS